MADEMTPCGTSGKLMFSRKKLIGSGSMGTSVFEGVFEKTPVAIKRIIKSSFREFDENIVEASDVNEAKLLREFKHDNIIRYYLADENEDFIYIALELCIGCLVDYLEKGRNKQTKQFLFPDELYDGENKEIFKKVLLQGISLGLDYLHDENIIHGDLKPQNILLKSDNHKTRGFNFKAVLTDFGLSLKIEDGRRSKTAHDDLIGSYGWRPKEVILMLDKGRKVKGTKPVDVFAFGCIVQYVMSKSSNVNDSSMHPFGEDMFRKANIKAGNRCSFLSSPKRKYITGVLGDLLIGLCIQTLPELRPTTKEINKHPFFWEEATQTEFVERVFNDIKSLPKDDTVRIYLEETWTKYHKHPFCSAIPHVWAYIKKHRGGYNPNLLFDLLRAIRNIKQHYDEIKMNPQLKDLGTALGSGNDEDFAKYFLQRILQILPIVHLCFYRHPKIDTKAYQSYYHIDEESAKLTEHRLECSFNTLNTIFNGSNTNKNKRNRTVSGTGGSSNTNSESKKLPTKKEIMKPPASKQLSIKKDTVVEKDVVNKDSIEDSQVQSEATSQKTKKKTKAKAKTFNMNDMVGGLVTTTTNLE